MTAARSVRVGICLALLLAGCGMMSGCMSSPTYGTDKTSAEQLVDDLGAAVSIGSIQETDKKVKYTPRPSLVMPAQAEKEALVTPQQTLATKDNPNWVESPEETRARLVAEADANSANTNYRSPLIDANTASRRLSAKEQQQAYRDARAVQKGAYTDRRFLTDPPAGYRDAGDPAALTDLGEPELKKEKRRKKQAQVAKSSSWWMPFQ